MMGIGIYGGKTEIGNPYTKPQKTLPAFPPHFFQNAMRESGAAWHPKGMKSISPGL
jgi:hypothetical protein